MVGLVVLVTLGGRQRSRRLTTLTIVVGPNVVMTSNPRAHDRYEQIPHQA
jgi:hypothetical protein